MKSFGIIAASALFGALVNAAPVNKRNMVWVTETDIDVVTIPVTMTVWVDGGATSTESAAPTTTLQADFFHPSLYPPVSSTTAAPVETSTSTSSSSSVYVAPTTSSTSVYVAPTSTSTSVYVAPTTSSTSTSIYVAPTTSSSSTSTSIYVAPTTTSSSVVAAPTTTEAPTSTYVAPTTTSSTAAAATTSASSSSGSGVAAAGTSYTGDLTWYDVGLGACGWTNVATDAIVAISEDIYDNPEYATANPNNNPLCGRFVSITGVDGSQYKAKVVDRCTGCDESSLDLSQDFFNTVTNNGDGRVHDITWSWL